MNKSPQLSFKTPADIKIFRDRHGMNQTGFWSRVGVTQSGGSRYEDRVPGRGVRSGRWVIVSGKLERVSLQPLAG